MPKLLYLLRTADYTFLNVNLNDDQWLQASLPVGEAGLRIRSAQMLAPSAFLASAASIHSPRQRQLLARPVCQVC